MIVRRRCPLADTCPKVKDPPPDLFSRREWIKHFVLGSAASAGLGSIPVLAEIAPTTNPNSLIRLKLSDYPALQTNFGSIQLTLFADSSNPFSPIPNGIITITRASGTVFHAVSASCTHAGTITDRYRDGDIICYDHGSVYDIQGRVLSPAEEGQANLPYYNSQLDGDSLLIHIPNLNLKVGPIVTASVSGTSKRFRLSFHTNAHARYRVRFTPNFGAPPLTVPFATTPSGPANQTQLTTEATAGNRDVWVDATTARGFYTIELIISPYLSP
jgi:nitrite reductase/ring-hydroxylating ferredoxin subunit